MELRILRQEDYLGLSMWALKAIAGTFRREMEGEKHYRRRRRRIRGQKQGEHRDGSRDRSRLRHTGGLQKLGKSKKQSLCWSL